MTPPGIEPATFQHVAQCPQNVIRTDWISPTPCTNVRQNRSLRRRRFLGMCRRVTGHFPEFEEKVIRNTGKHKRDIISQDKRNLDRITVETPNVARVTFARF